MLYMLVVICRNFMAIFGDPRIGGTLQSTSTTKKAPVSKIIHGTQFQNLPSGLTPQRQRIVYYYFVLKILVLLTQMHHSHIFIHLCTSSILSMAALQNLKGKPTARPWVAHSLPRRSGSQPNGTPVGHWVTGLSSAKIDRKPGFLLQIPGVLHIFFEIKSGSVGILGIYVA